MARSRPFRLEKAAYPPNRSYVAVLHRAHLGFFVPDLALRMHEGAQLGFFVHSSQAMLAERAIIPATNRMRVLGVRPYRKNSQRPETLAIIG